MLAHVPSFGRNPRGSPDFLAYPVPKACMHALGTRVPRRLGVARSASSPKAALALGCSLTPGLRISFGRVTCMARAASVPGLWALGFLLLACVGGWVRVPVGRGFCFHLPVVARVLGGCVWARFVVLSLFCRLFVVFVVGLWCRPAFGTCVVSCVFPLPPGLSGSGVRCGRACWARVSAVPRPSGLGCRGVFFAPFFFFFSGCWGSPPRALWSLPPSPFFSAGLLAFFFFFVGVCLFRCPFPRWAAVPGLVLPVFAGWSPCACSGVLSSVPSGWGVWPPSVFLAGGLGAVGSFRAAPLSPPPLFFWGGGGRGAAWLFLPLPSLGWRLLCGWCVVRLVPRHSWRRFLCATPRHSWLDFAAGGGGQSPPLLAGVRWRWWCVVCGVWRWCVGGVVAGVWCGWSLTTPGRGSCVLLPATPGWVSLPLVVGGPRHSWLGSVGGVAVWCVVCGGGVLVGLWLVCGVVGPSPLLAVVPVCYSPPLLAGFRCRWWWAVPAFPGWGPLAAVVCGVWCVVCGGGVLLGLWLVCGVWRWCVVGVVVGVWCGWSLATPGGGPCVLLPATPGWVSLPVVVGGPRHSWLGSVGGGGVWCVVCGVLVGSLATPGGGSCVLLPATPGWVSLPLLVGGPRHSWLGSAGGGGVWCVGCGVWRWCVVGVVVGVWCGWSLAPPGGGPCVLLPATPGWVSLPLLVGGPRNSWLGSAGGGGVWCVVCGVWRWCVGGVVVGVWCGWSLTTPGGGPCVLLPATPGWVSLPVVVGGPRHSWLGSVGGGGLWCVVCSWGSSPLLAEVPVCYSPPLLAGLHFRCWWAVPVTPGWGPLAAVPCGVCSCACFAWPGRAGRPLGRVLVRLTSSFGRFVFLLCLAPSGPGLPLSLSLLLPFLVGCFSRPPAASLSARSRLVCVPRLAVGCSLVVAPPPPSPFVSRGFRRSCLGPWCFFFFSSFFFFLCAPPLSPVFSGFRPRVPWALALALFALFAFRFWALRALVALSCFPPGCWLLPRGCCPPPPPLCFAVFVPAARCCVPCCAVLPWVRCCAALLRVVSPGVLLSCAVLRSCGAAACCAVPSGAARRPGALCSAALCFAVFPRTVCSVLCVFCRGAVVRAVVRRSALCCVCLGVLCCAFPVLSVLCGAVLRGAGALVLCCSCGACCCWRLVLWCAAVCCAVSCGVPWCGAGSGGPWLSAGGVFRCRCPCLAGWSASLWLVWFAVVPCFPVSCSVVLCCRVVLCCCAPLSCCGAVGACFALLWAVVLCCVVLLVGCAVFGPVVVSACCGALFLVLCVPCLLRSVRCGALLCWLWCPASLCRVLWRCAVVWCCAVVLCCRFAVLFVLALPSCGLSCGASVACAVVGASCCGVSFCVVVSPWAFCGVVVLLWCVVVSCCAVRCPVVSCALCRVLRCRAALRCCAVCFSFCPVFLC